MSPPHPSPPAPPSWPPADAAITGGKVKGGRVIGASDSKGAFPKDNPKSPQDVLATIYDHLGIDTKKQYQSDAGRPISVLPSLTVIRELF